MFWTRLCTLICTAFFLLSAPALAAGDFPTRTINVINAWLPGGIGEMAYRPVGDELAKILKTNVVLVPSAGAGGLMGVNKALSSRPNGYNLLLTTDASLIGLSTLRKVRWSMDDFIPVGSLGSPIGSYSHGMKQKLAIISALIRQPRLLILDEPFVGLDPVAAHLLKGYLHEVCESGGAVFFSTHVLEVAEKLCDRIGIIRQGRLVEVGATEDIVGNSTLEDVFLELEGEKDRD